MSTLITVGNAKQPFTRLLNQVHLVLPILPHPVVVQHGHSPFSDINCAPKAFLEMEEFGRLITESRVAIMHAGAGSIITALTAGHIPIVVPRLSRYGEHIDDHQLEFAKEMSRLGKVILVENVDDLGEAIKKAKERTSRRNTGTEAETRLVRLVREVLAKNSL